jgi:DNA processing protein
MIQKIDFHINELANMKEYPKELFYIGNTNLLKNKKIAIVGTRKPNSYTKNFTHQLSQKLSQNNITIISGAAMGVDAIAHQSSNNNTIAVVANSLDIRYPAVNRNLIQNIEQNSLILSAYEPTTKARNYTFVHRNEIVVALADIVIITQADLKSGSLTSAKYALSMGKPIYVLPHRIGDSQGTNELLKNGNAKAIYDIDQFLKEIGINKKETIKDEFLQYCSSNPTYDDAVIKYASKVFEYELLGSISIKDGKIYLS